MFKRLIHQDFLNEKKPQTFPWKWLCKQWWFISIPVGENEDIPPDNQVNTYTEYLNTNHALHEYNKSFEMVRNRNNNFHQNIGD